MSTRSSDPGPERDPAPAATGPRDAPAEIDPCGPPAATDPCGPSAATGPRGYHGAAHAAALTGIGRAVPFGATGGHVLVRAIPGSDRQDLSGPYPVFACADWGAMAGALADPPRDALGRPPVTLTLVADPFCPLPDADLAALFDLCRPFHDHWLIDLAAPLAPSRHHRRKLKQAGAPGVAPRIEAGPADPAFAPAFVALYAHLAAKKGIADLRAFPADSLAAQLSVPGAHLVTAWEGDTLLGADLYYHEGAVVRAHLSAYAPEGYARGVSYPMMAAAVEHFRPLAALLDLGGAPAADAGAAGGGAGGGVGHFKQGWTRLSRPSHLCGKVFDSTAYAALSEGRRTAWFPAYRAGEYAGPA